MGSFPVVLRDEKARCYLFNNADAGRGEVSPAEGIEETIKLIS